MVLFAITNLLLFFGLGIYEIGILLLAIILLFNGNKIPGITRELGKGMQLFNSTKETLENELKGKPTPPPTEKKEEES